MNKGFKKAVVCALSAGLMIGSVAGCGKKEAKDTFDTTKTAVTVGDSSVSVGVVNLGVRYAQASVEYLYRQYFGMEDPFNTDMYGSGSTIGDTTKKDIAETLGKALLAEQHMADYGIEFSEAEKATAAIMAEEFMAENDAETLEKLHIDKDSVVRYMELNAIKSKVEAAMCADVDTNVSDEEAAQRRIKYALFTADAEKEAEEAETETELETQSGLISEAAQESAQTEQMEAATPEEETAALEEETTAKTKAEDQTEAESEAETEDPETAAYMAKAYEHAEAMIEELKAGGDFDEVTEKFGKNASEITLGADYSITQVAEATEGLADGAIVEVPVASNSNSYYVIQVVSALDEEATQNKKDSIVSERKNEKIEEVYGVWQEETAIESDDAALATITFDSYLNPAYDEVAEAETEAQTE